MNQEPKISIIVPVYNTEKYIEDCIKSVIHQTYLNWELVLIDDGSTDSSYLICKKFADKDPRICLYHQENKGQGAARNYALGLCHGEYITYLDSDDIVHERLLEDLLNVREESKADIVTAKIDTFTSKPQSKADGDCVKKVYSGGFFENFIIEKNWQNHVIVSKLYKKDLISTISFPELRAIEDEFFLTEVFFKAEKVVSINSVRYFYRQTENSTMRGGYNPHRALIIDALQRRAEVCRNANMEQLANIVDGQCLLECMDWWNQFNQHDDYTKAGEIRAIFIDIYKFGLKSKMLTRKDVIRIKCFYVNPYMYINLIKFLGKRLR